MTHDVTRSRRIFLAHASDDKEQVRRLCGDLKARGFEPWLDEEDLIAGLPWEPQIENAIHTAAIFVACLSSRSVAKVGFVQNEFRTALKVFGEHPPGSIYLIPARLDDCDVPDLQIPNQGLSLRKIHWVDLWKENGIEHLVRSLNQGLGNANTARLRDGGEASRVSTPAVGVVERHTAGERFRDCPDCPELVVVPAGSFMMGSPSGEQGRGNDEGPRHRVTIAEPIAVGVYEVTFAEWDACVAAGGCRYRPVDQGWGRGNRPVINVSWEDAQEYVQWLSRETGQDYRLLSEAAWEYAARAGTATPFHFGSTISTDQANYDGNYTYGSGRKGVYREQTTPVGSFPANKFGLHDVHGNVWEWVEDRWHDSYSGAPSDGSVWNAGNNSRRVFRGGSWDYVPDSLRAAFRYGNEPDLRYYGLGFRVARTLR